MASSSEVVGGGGFVAVPVPGEDVIAVYTFLAERAAARAGNAVGDAVPTTQPNVSGAAVNMWTEDGLARFAGSGVETAQVVSKVYDFLAEHPNSWFGIQELAEESGQKYEQLRYIWGHLARHLKAQYGGLKAPSQSCWGYEIGRTPAKAAFFKFDDAMAQQWKQVRAA